MKIVKSNNDIKEGLANGETYFLAGNRKMKLAFKAYGKL